MLTQDVLPLKCVIITVGYHGRREEGGKEWRWEGDWCNFEYGSAFFQVYAAKPDDVMNKVPVEKHSAQIAFPQCLLHDFVKQYQSISNSECVGK